MRVFQRIFTGKFDLALIVTLQIRRNCSVLILIFTGIRHEGIRPKYSLLRFGLPS